MVRKPPYMYTWHERQQTYRRRIPRHFRETRGCGVCRRKDMSARWTLTRVVQEEQASVWRIGGRWQRANSVSKHGGLEPKASLPHGCRWSCHFTRFLSNIERDPEPRAGLSGTRRVFFPYFFFSHNAHHRTWYGLSAPWTTSRIQ